MTLITYCVHLNYSNPIAVTNILLQISLAENLPPLLLLTVIVLDYMIVGWTFHMQKYALHSR
jgi:hypothetical protein